MPDIANVDYLAQHQGRTNLEPLDGLPVFVDDFYAYGPLRQEETVSVLGRFSCSSGEVGAARRIVGKISLFVRDVSGEKDGYKHVAIVHTVSKNARSSCILQTVEKIERETNH